MSSIIKVTLSLFFVLSLLVFCTATETSDSLRARLSVRRNNLKAGDSKVETAADAVKESGDLRARLTRMFKLSPQQPQQQQVQEQPQQQQVETESPLEIDPIFLEIAVDVNNETDSNDGVVLLTYVTIIEEKVKAQMELFERIVASAKEAHQQKNVKLLAELMAQMQAVEDASSASNIDVDAQMAQIEDAIAKKDAERKAEVEKLIEHIRPALEQAEAAEHEPKKTIGIRNELKFSYAAIKNAINAVQESKAKELLVEIALRYPRVGATLGLFNNKDASTSNANATEATESSDVDPKQQQQEQQQQQQQQPQQRKSFLERDAARVASDVNPATLAVNANRLRQQLSKTR